MKKSEIKERKPVNRVFYYLRRFPLVITLTILFTFQPIISFAAPTSPNDNHIILPEDGRVIVNFISTNASCTGDFGLHFPQEELIYPDYLYYRGFPFQLSGYYPQGTELVFYITPRDFCTGGPYLSTDLNRARITHPDSDTWIISWEDLVDKDFNDLIVQVDFQPAMIPFLDLPYDYAGSTFVDESRDTELHGKVNAYFDHQYPTYCNLPNTGGCSSLDTRAVNFLGYDGSQINPSPPYRVVYNGHDGIDYFIPEGTAVLAAAPGTVSFVDGISATCSDGQTKTANVIKIQHANGYITEYWHLSFFAQGISGGSAVARDPSYPIGYVGSTGCSDGPHMHFVVRNPNGIVVDPYGWMPLPDAAWYDQSDPWQQWKYDNGGANAKSHYLWIHELVISTLLSRSEPTVITSTSGMIAAAFPAGAYTTPLRVQLMEGLHSALIPGYWGLYSFSLFGFTTDNTPVTTLSREITLNVFLPEGEQQKFSVSKMVTPTLQVWDPLTSSWQELPTTWDPLTNSARATTSKIGAFALTTPELRLYLPLASKDVPTSK